MNVLWVEDFNGESDTTEETLREKVIIQYQLEDHVIIEYNNMKDALNYIKNNPFSFDIVLLDINLLDGSSVDDDLYQEIYKNYFCGVITKEFYRRYYKDSKGILLFQYLRESMKFSKNRIAFLSAYVPKDFSEEHTLLFPEIKDEGEGEENNINRVYQTFHEKIKAGLGVEPLAFPKPKLIETVSNRPSRGKPMNEQLEKAKSSVNEPARVAFRETLYKVNSTEYDVFRRNIIEMSLIILKAYEQSASTENPYFGKFLKIMEIPIFKTPTPDGQAGVDVFDEDYFESLLVKTKKLPLEMLGVQGVENGRKEEEDEVLRHYLRDLVFCADCFFNNFKDCPQVTLLDKGAVFVLKPFRNWLSHGGTGQKGENSDSVQHKQFIVPLFFRLVFDIPMIGKLLSEEDLERYEKFETILLETNVNPVKIDEFSNFLNKLYHVVEHTKQTEPKKGRNKNFPIASKPVTLYQEFLVKAYQTVPADVPADGTPEYKFLQYAYHQCKTLCREKSVL